MLSILATILSWDDAEREKAGLQKVGKGKAPLIRRKSSAKDVERSAEEEAAMNEVSREGSHGQVCRDAMTQRSVLIPRNSHSRTCLSNFYSRKHPRVKHALRHRVQLPTCRPRASSLLHLLRRSRHLVLAKIHLRLIRTTTEPVACRRLRTVHPQADPVNCQRRVEKPATVSPKRWRAGSQPGSSFFSAWTRLATGGGVLRVVS